MKVLNPSLALSLTLMCALGAAGTLGCSDDGEGQDGTGGGSNTGGGSDDGTFPSDTSEAGIKAFLETGSYKSAPWTGDSTVRVDPADTVPGNIHGSVKVFYNPTATQSIAAGNNELNSETPNTQGSMAVKELYDDSGVLVGIAASLKTGAAKPRDNWTYYCESTNDGCTGSLVSEPIYGVGVSSCSNCHSGLFFPKD